MKLIIILLLLTLLLPTMPARAFSESMWCIEGSTLTSYALFSVGASNYKASDVETAEFMGMSGESIWIQDLSMKATGYWTMPLGEVVMLIRAYNASGGQVGIVEIRTLAGHEDIYIILPFSKRILKQGQYHPDCGFTLPRLTIDHWIGRVIMRVVR